VKHSGGAGLRRQDRYNRTQKDSEEVSVAIN